jgi:hypothetical protein
MYPWEIALSASSPNDHLDYWGRLRSLGRPYYIRTCSLLWSSAALGAALFADLVYHFARYGVWGFGAAWAWLFVLSVLASLAVFSRRWFINERFYQSLRA